MKKKQVYDDFKVKNARIRLVFIAKNVFTTILNVICMAG